MGKFETAAWAAMVADQLSDDGGHPQPRTVDGAPDRSEPVGSYTEAAQTITSWRWYPLEAVLLIDGSDQALRVASVADLDDQQEWPPAGVLAAWDGSWVLGKDLRISRLR